MATSDLEGLRDKLLDAAKSLAKVTEKKMFGCHGLFTDDKIFALVWKHGRLAVKIPDADRFGELMALPGSAPWRAGTMSMAHWVLVPPGFHEDERSLVKWVRTAHAMAASSIAKPKSKPTSKKAATDRTRTTRKKS